MFHVNLQGCSGTCTRPFNMWTWSFFPLDLREVWREATPGSEYTYPTERESRKIIDSKVPLKGVMLAPRRVLVSLNQLTITKQSYFAIGETFPVSRDSHVTKNEHNYVAIFRSIWIFSVLFLIPSMYDIFTCIWVVCMVNAENIAYMDGRGVLGGVSFTFWELYVFFNLHENLLVFTTYLEKISKIQLMVEKSGDHHLGCNKTSVKNGINYQPQLVCIAHTFSIFGGSKSTEATFSLDSWNTIGI